MRESSFLVQFCIWFLRIKEGNPVSMYRLLFEWMESGLLKFSCTVFYLVG